jgi:hypothetical protein
MTWLALRIFGYLLVALVIGGVAGWMLAKLNRRDRWHLKLIQAGRETGELHRQLDARAEEVRRLQDALAAKPVIAVEVSEAPDIDVPVVADPVSQEMQRDEQKTGQDIEAMRMQATASDNLIRALHRENTRLRLAAEESRARARPVAALELTVKDLEGRLVRKMAEIDRMHQTLASEERKIRDLERERELQNKSLHVLHQQLEMERKLQRFVG